MRITFSIAAVAGVVLTACGSAGPKPPDWAFEAKASVDRASAAYMEGNSRVEAAEMARARSQLSRSGRPDLAANAELAQCATRVASLVFEPCAGFETLREDSTPAQRAYADYLIGKATPQSAALLPEPQRATAAGGAALPASADALSQLVAAGVLLQTGRASPPVITQAIDIASNQGWRRPLLAWLGVQAQRAEQGGDAAEAARLKRRIALVQGQLQNPASANAPGMPASAPRALP